MRFRRPLAALLLTGALTVAGCGDDATVENAYVEDVRAAQQLFVSRFDQVLKRLTPTSTLAQDRATLARFAAVAGGFATGLQRVDPPDDVRDDHRRLVAAVTGYQRRVQRAGADLRDGSPAQRARVRTELSSSVEGTQTEIAAVVEQINAGLRD